MAFVLPALEPATVAPATPSAFSRHVASAPSAAPAAVAACLLVASRRIHRRRVPRRATAAPDVPVDRERYTDAAWQAMQAGPEFAQRAESQYVEPEHVFLACLEQQVTTTGGLCARILEKVGIKKQAAVERIVEPCHEIPSSSLSLRTGAASSPRRVGSLCTSEGLSELLN